ncbi:MAG: hypothetical protein ERJ67_03130 [Aphanocapsa feldmannii 277cV]|uniref:Uncharacterized protein n=1 Tax=Aphanocapsa feldmannii 277cV TaxID=2507553 RepID=A0A524RPX5_9CHRO|nr:MAG: hypothetical protein ERJ67_03130 [Aphanocapsa feldmannii 277cV]
MQPFEVIHTVLQRRAVGCFSVDERRRAHAKSEARLQRTGVALWGCESPLFGDLRSEGDGGEAEASEHQHTAQLQQRHDYSHVYSL